MIEGENMGMGRINPFPGQATEWVDYSQGSGGSDDPNHSDVRGFTQDPAHATAVTSIVRNTLAAGPFGENRMHKPVLDIDMPVRVVESSTPGHHHLFIDRAMSWDQYVRLLCVLAEVGIVEPGYVSASIERGHTSVRLPDVKRETPRAELHPAAQLGEVNGIQARGLPVSMPANLDDPTMTTSAPWYRMPS